MTKQQTYEILKYGYMNPNRVRQILSNYFDIEPNRYVSDWTEFNDIGTSSGMFVKTHFLKIWVYYDDLDNRLIIALYCNDKLDYNLVQQHYIAINNSIAMDVTDLTEDELTSEFHDIFEDINRMCLSNEYKRNFPGGGYEH